MTGKCVPVGAIAPYAEGLAWFKYRLESKRLIQETTGGRLLFCG
ncbi:MAG: hypothetical protein PHV07_01395 [Oscillospiraceae bacterium]|nr:hypothetical protein [Oscillospiraceae bacterium]